MEFPKARSVFLSLAVAIALYALLLPAWFAIRPAYNRGITSVVTKLAFPALGIEGSVSPAPESSIVLVYVLPSPVHKVWGRIKQRLLDTADLPLALAVAAGLGFLGWKRRLFVAGSGFAILTFVHAGLVTWSGIQLTRILADPKNPAHSLDQTLHRAAEGIGAYRDISTGLIVVLMGLLAAVAARAGRSHGLSTDEDNPTTRSPSP